MCVAVLLTVVLGGLGMVSSQARPLDLALHRPTNRWEASRGEGNHLRSGYATDSDHYGADRSAAPLQTPYAPQNRLIGPGEAARRAQLRYGGRVLGVELVRDGAPYYRVKLLRNGNVRVVRIPAGR